MAEVKGVQVRATIQFLRNRFGNEAVDREIHSLDSADQQLLPSLLLDSNWYSYSIWRPVRRISRALSDETGNDLAIDLGKFMAQYVFTGVYKSLLMNDPAKLLEKFPGIHEFFYRDTSSIQTELQSPTSGLVSYRYGQGIRPARSACLTTMGFWIRTLELSGGEKVKATHTQCMAEGKNACLFLFEWR
jgi:hypothetical protein